MHRWGMGPRAWGRARARGRKPTYLGATAVVAALAAAVLGYGTTIAPRADADLLSMFFGGTTWPSSTSTSRAAPTTTTALAPREPVLVVCGWHNPSSPQDCQSSVAPLVNYLRSQWYDAYWVDTAKSNDNVENAKAIAATAQSVLAQPRYAWAGITRVNIVGHSNGGYSARYYIENGGQATVHRYIAVGTGHYGASQACGVHDLLAMLGTDDVGLAQMCSKTDDYDGSNPFLQGLNGRRNKGANGGGKDDTPYGVMPWAFTPGCNPDPAATACKNDDGPNAHIEYYSLWLDPGDTGITSWDFPWPLPSSHRLDGGACLAPVANISVTAMAPGWDHTSEPSRGEVQRAVAQALNGTCPGTPTYVPW